MSESERDPRDARIERLLDTVRMYEALVEVLAHDLKNPLGAIATCAQLMLGRDPDERVVKPLRRILASGRRMTRMVDQLLDFSHARSEEGLALAKRRVDLAALCRVVLEDLDPEGRVQAEYQGVLTGHWDEPRLERVFAGLIAEALSRGRQGSVKLNADGRGAIVEVRVRSTGAIPSSVASTLFDPLACARDRRSGQGLRLYVAREVVRAHGGTLECLTSAENDATDYVVQLPR